MTRSELQEAVEKELKSLACKFEAGHYEQAIDDALRETGAVFPITNATLILWTKRRTKRHLFYMMLTESAYKFKFEQINLQMRFDHFWKLIQEEDAAFVVALENELWWTGIDPTQIFGHKVDAGFSYNELGEDTTYSDDNVVAVSPSSTEVSTEE